VSVVGRMMGFGRDDNYDRAIRLYDQGDYPGAIEAFTQVLACGKDPVVVRLAKFYTAEAYSCLGQEAMKRHEYRHAADYYDKALAIHPNYADLRYHAALACRKLKDYEAAEEHLHEALTINPRFARAVYEQGLLSYEQGNREMGLKRLQQALSLNPPFRNEKFARAFELHEKGQHERALTTFEAVIEEESPVAVHARVADALYKRGLFLQAAEEYEKAIHLAPTYADLRCHYGLALHALGRTDESIEQYKKALEINPKYVAAQLHLAVTYRDTDQPEMAQEAFQRVLELDPNNIIAKNNIHP